MTTTANINRIDHEGSSLLKESIYDLDNKTLEVTFQNGAKYMYTNIDTETYQEFSTVESKGSYFGKNIRGKFEYQKVEEDGNQKSK
jgi:hypothetical protein